MKIKRNSNLKMNLQLFADPAPANPPADPTPPAAPSTHNQTPAVDYVKIQQMLEGTLSAKEDTALKAYFKQQGLSESEMGEAIAAFKQQKAAQQPDVGALTQQAQTAQAAAQKAQIESAATIAAVSLGLDVKTIPYAIKMADLSQAVGQDGKVSEEAVTNALKKVLEDVPALKPQPGQVTGFVQVGASGSGQQTNTDDALKKAFGL